LAILGLTDERQCAALIVMYLSLSPVIITMKLGLLMFTIVLQQQCLLHERLTEILLNELINAFPTLALYLLHIIVPEIFSPLHYEGNNTLAMLLY
jgi:hypothetical protein